MLKKYNVECKIGDKEMIEGTKPWDDIYQSVAGDYTEAVNEEEAIELVKDWVIDQTNIDDYNIYDIDRTDDEIKITDVATGDVTLYYDFIATEVMEN